MRTQHWRPCEHGRYDRHALGLYEREVLTEDGKVVLGEEEAICPGGILTLTPNDD